jgi:hypothetical protein
MREMGLAESFLATPSPGLVGANRKKSSGTPPKQEGAPEDAAMALAGNDRLF